MEKNCTYLIFDETVVRSEPGELAAGLESPDVKIKVATLKKTILLMLNGEQLGSLLMKVIQYVVPNEVRNLWRKTACSVPSSARLSSREPPSTPQPPLLASPHFLMRHSPLQGAACAQN